MGDFAKSRSNVTALKVTNLLAFCDVKSSIYQVYHQLLPAKIGILSFPTNSISSLLINPQFEKFNNLPRMVSNTCFITLIRINYPHAMSLMFFPIT
ncbi:hypothetical protein H5410_049224 [Solanum commersonii]|uniref:Uncharacterized protein n=1 Tax=Solanum commersonii TaxID=4109 RepID=A0A9J5XP47_SOLCO|nr:hypothetical protein H5410_049224 [Solanum commersonii]